jgi:hypothetical protein
MKIVIKIILAMEQTKILNQKNVGFTTSSNNAVEITFTSYKLNPKP